MRYEDRDKKLSVSKKGYELVQRLFRQFLIENEVLDKDFEEKQSYRYGDSFDTSRNGQPLSVGSLIKLDQGYLVLLGESEGRVLAAKFGRISERIEEGIMLNDVDENDFRGFWTFPDLKTYQKKRYDNNIQR